MKYTKEFKLHAVKQFKKGITIPTPDGLKYSNWHNKILYWSHIYDNLGEAGLNHNKLQLTIKEKIKCIHRLENGESANAIGESIGRQGEQISRWYKIYRQYGIDGLKSLKRGRNKKMKKPSNDKNKSELEKLREENEYLKAENEYLKKLRALIQKEEKDQPPDKK